MVGFAEIISVGTELLLGNVVNSDAQFISEQLATVGVDVLYHTVVGDNYARLQEVIAIARKRADLLIFTGGLGPTYDDFTKVGVCDAFDLRLVRHEELVEEIRRFYREVLHLEMTQSNLQQADQPEGCTILHNPVGTAPSCLFEKDGITVVMLPGVPHECRFLTEHALIPWLRERCPETITSHEIRVFGLSEPDVQEMMGDLMDVAVNPSIAPYAKIGEVLLRLTAKGENKPQCEKLMAPVLKNIEMRLGDYIYGVDVDNLESVVKVLLEKKNLMFAAAESCTGGLIAKRITDVPGASAVFAGGVVSYTNAVKAGVLNVPENLLEQYGAVSAPVAKAMAEGVRMLTGADIGVSVTGVAGPDRDDRGNEVGTVFIALSADDGVKAYRLALGQGRDRVRTMAAHRVFDMMRRYLLHLPQRDYEVVI